MSNGNEIAVLTVAGHDFQDWESVWVQCRYGEGWAEFRFTAVERDPMPGNWTKLQFKPGDDCTISLGGELALTGVITVRQTAYDENSHQVMLMGKSLTAWAAKSSVDTKTGSFDGMTFEQVGRKVLEPYGANIKIIGTLDQKPFEKLQNQIGEKIWDFLERIARPRGIVLGSDSYGNWLFIGEHANSPSATLVEGINIKKCQCVIDANAIFSEYRVVLQGSGSDQSSGSQTNEIEGKPVSGSSKKKAVSITPGEQPGDQEDADRRTKYESIWHQGTILQATIVTQGWKRPGAGSLWVPGDKVSVNSPMAMLNDDMDIQTVTFSQDNESGTITTLDLVAPWLLRDSAEFSVSMPQAGQPMKATTPDDKAPAPTPQQRIDQSFGTLGPNNPAKS
jgi:prophage tail gpP-like protein